MEPSILFHIFPDFLNNFFAWLATPLIKLSWIEIHYGWGLIHLISGFIIMLVLIKIGEERPIFSTFLILAVFEALEFLISYVLPIILKESIADTSFDLLIGMSGALIAWLIFRER